MELLLRMQNISKSFGTNQVLREVQFELRAGEVHALIGENGAGKSTLMKILMGIYSADNGRITVFGKEQTFESPSQALHAKVAMIHQELNPIMELSVAENIFMGKEERRGIFVDKKKQEEKTREYLGMLGVEIPPGTLMKELNVSEMQMVEIAKALSYGARIIIMDEPTSAITDSEVEKLFGNIRKLKEQGAGIVYISHKMNELFEISDRITVFRDGQYTVTAETKNVTPQRLIKAMVGREINEIYPEHKSHAGETLLSVKNAGREGEFKDISFELHRGEKLGIAGLMGAGRTELVMALFGARKLTGGSVEIKGEAVDIRTPRDAIRRKIALVTEDRKLYGLNLIGCVGDNIVSVVERKYSKGIFHNRRKCNGLAEDMVKRLSIKVTGIRQITGSLSGGNQQKVVLAKWLLNEPDIIIFDEPTRGIDVGAKTEIYKIIEELACEGKGIIIISSEMPELIGLSHRMIVLNEGRMTGGLDIDELTQENIMTLASGCGKGDA